MNLIDYLSPVSEASLYKNIPISEYNEQNRKEIRKLIGKEVRFLFRGPRPARPGRTSYTRQSYCVKFDAKTFAVYVRR